MWLGDGCCGAEYGNGIRTPYGLISHADGILGYSGIGWYSPVNMASCVLRKDYLYDGVDLSSRRLRSSLHNLFSCCIIINGCSVISPLVNVEDNTYG